MYIDLLKVNDVGERINICRNQVYNLMSSGDCRSSKSAARRGFPQAPSSRTFSASSTTQRRPFGQTRRGSGGFDAWHQERTGRRAPLTGQTHVGCGPTQRSSHFQTERDGDEQDDWRYVLLASLRSNLPKQWMAGMPSEQEEKAFRDAARSGQLEDSDDSVDRVLYMSKDGKPTLVQTGFRYRLNKNMEVIPNITFTGYGRNLGQLAADDTIFKLTLHLKF